jgi:hypothetical protein
MRIGHRADATLVGLADRMILREPWVANNRPETHDDLGGQYEQAPTMTSTVSPRGNLGRTIRVETHLCATRTGSSATTPKDAPVAGNTFASRSDAHSPLCQA